MFNAVKPSRLEHLLDFRKKEKYRNTGLILIQAKNEVKKELRQLFRIIFVLTKTLKLYFKAYSKFVNKKTHTY